MFDLDKGYGFNEKLADEGVKMVIGPDEKEDYFLIRRIPNKDYTREMNKVQQANHKMLEYLKRQDSDKHSELNTKLLCDVMGKTVLVGWGTIVVGGKKVKYSSKEAVKLLVDYRDFKSDVIDFATDNNNYPLELDVEEIKKH